jgi:hypothetical protein
MQDCADCKGVGKLDIADDIPTNAEKADKLPAEIVPEVIIAQDTQSDKPIVKRRMGRAPRIKAEG